MTPKEQFIAWLNDAYSMEIAALPVLQNHADDAKDYPEVRRRDLEHLAETKHQAERLKKMITELGGKVSFAKTMIGKVAGLGQSISTEIFPDELIKNFLADFATESFEIASYQSLIATAKEIGEHQCVPVLEEILREEIAMARWIEEHIAFATRETLKITTGQAKRQKSVKSSGQRRSINKRKILGMSPALATVVTGGALGAAAVLLTQSKKQPKKLHRAERKDFAPSYADASLASTPEVTVETLIIAIDDDNDQNTNPTSFAASNR